MRLVQLVAVVSAFALGCGKEQPTGGPPGGPTAPSGTAPTSGDLSAATPDVTMTAAAWSKEFAANTKAANAKYNGKVIELTGVVHEVSVVSAKPAPPRVVLKGAGGDAFEVYCLLSDPAVWERVWEGSTVTVRGRLRTTPNWPGELEPAIVLKGPNEPVPTMTAEAMAADVLATVEDPTKKKAWQDWEACYLEGEVLQVKASEESLGSRITLKGKGNCNPVGVVSYWERQRLAELKPGDLVKMLGKFTFAGDMADDNSPSPYLMLVTYRKQ